MIKLQDIVYSFKFKSKTNYLFKGIAYHLDLKKYRHPRKRGLWDVSLLNITKPEVSRRQLEVLGLRSRP